MTPRMTVKLPVTQCRCCHGYGDSAPYFFTVKVATLEHLATKMAATLVHTSAAG